MTPEGWGLLPLGDLAGFINGDRGKNYPSRKDFVESGIPFINAGHIKNGQVEIADMNFITEQAFDLLGGGKVREDDLLYCLRGSLGKVALLRGGARGAIASSLVILRPHDHASAKYLYHVLAGPVGETIARELDSGSAQPNISATNLKQYEIALPPLPEQRKIAAILSSVDAVIEKTEGVIEQLQVVKKAMMQELFTRGLPGRHTRFKQTEIGEIPEEWEVRELDECITPGRPVCYGILKPGKGHVGGVPVIKVKNIKGGRVVEGDLLLTTPALDEQYRRSRLQTGDVLLTIRGTTGRVAIVPATLDQANITQDTARLSIRPEVSRDYVYFGLQSPLLQAQIRDETRGQAVKGINIRDVRRLRISVPARDEQDEIAKGFRVQLDREHAEREQLATLRTVKSALMSVLLTGEVRVTPDEEPA